MAQDIGLLLRGLGAAFSNQVPQFRQELVQQQQMERQQREDEYTRQQRARQAQMQDYEFRQAIQDAGFQDAYGVSEFLKTNNIEGALGLLEDRMSLMNQMGISLSGDPTMQVYEDLKAAALGDTARLGRARATAGVVLAQGIGSGRFKMPEAQERVYRPGDVVVDAQGNVIREIPTAPSAKYRVLTAAEVQQRGLPPGNYQLNESTNQVSAIGAPSTVVNVGQATEGERNAGILANRLDFAQSQINDILTTAPEAEKPAVGATALNTLGLEYLARVANPAERQIIEAAQMDMLDSALTLGTGAAYTREQLEGYRTSYFPQLGDDPRTIRAKSQRLNNLVNAAYEKAGRAAPTERRGSQTSESRAPQDWFASGLTQADWDALPDADKKAYLEAK
jgi:hypothetical protein